MIVASSAIGFVVSLFSNVLSNALGQEVYSRCTRLVARSIGGNHDMQRAFARAYLEGMRYLYNRYLNGHPSIPERALLEERCRQLASDRQHLEIKSLSVDQVLNYISPMRVDESALHTQLMDLAKERHLEGAPDGFQRLVEAELGNSILFFLREELKLNDRARYAFDHNLLLDLHTNVDMLASRLDQDLSLVRDQQARIEDKLDMVLASSSAPRNLAPAALPGGQDKPVWALISALESQDWQRREQAARTLLSLESDEAVAQLRPLLKSPQPDVALYAILILASVRPAEVVPNLLALTDYPDSTIRKIAWRDLRVLDSRQAIERMVAELASGEDRHRQRVAEILREKDPRITVSALEALVGQSASQSDWTTCRYAVHTLLMVDELAALPGLKVLAEHDPEPEVRAYACNQITRLQALHAESKLQG